MLVFAQKYSIKLERIYEFESSGKGEKKTTTKKHLILLSFNKYRASEASEEKQQHFVCVFSKT